MEALHSDILKNLVVGLVILVVACDLRPHRFPLGIGDSTTSRKRHGLFVSNAYRANRSPLRSYRVCLTIIICRFQEELNRLYICIFVLYFCFWTFFFRLCFWTFAIGLSPRTPPFACQAVDWQRTLASRKGTLAYTYQKGVSKRQGCVDC